MKSLVGIGKGLEKSGRLFLEYGDGKNCKHSFQKLENYLELLTDQVADQRGRHFRQQ